MPFTKETAKLYASKGGRANVKKHGVAHMRALGGKGGLKLMETRGKEYFSEIGSLPRPGRKSRKEGNGTTK